MNKLTVLAAILLPFLVSNLANAQNQPKIDSLNNVLETEISGRERVDTYNAIAKEYCNQDSVKTAFFLQKRPLNALGGVYYSQNEYLTALKYY